MGTCIIQTDRSSMMALKQRLKTVEIYKVPPYAIYQIKTRDCIITAYESNELIFQRNGIKECAALIAPPAVQRVQNGTTAKKTQGQSGAICPQAGSDEVGTGDYFGPVTVCAAYIRYEDVEFLCSLRIQDLKVIDDTAIRCMAPKLMERLPHSLLILDNAIYSRIYGENNMVVIKSRMHNQAYVHLRKKMGSLPQFCIADQSVQEASYYHYLKHEREVVYDTHFETKAENKYLSAAAGSIIARYAFLKAFNAMREQHDFISLRSAGSKVDQNTREFVAMHRKEVLFQVAKLYSVSTKKALG